MTLSRLAARAREDSKAYMGLMGTKRSSINAIDRQTTTRAALSRKGFPAQWQTRHSHAETDFPLVIRVCRSSQIGSTHEGGPRRAAVDIGGEALVAGDDVGVLQDAQHCRHHEIASREAVAVK